ncbi:GOLPH3/VPS74 family protein [Nonomuraea sp. NPDC002799]
METPEWDERGERGESLPRSAFLLTFDLRKERLHNKGQLGYLVRAAALAELLLGGNLADEAGKALALSPPRRHAGPLQELLWEQISQSEPRPWRHWVRKESTRSYRLVRDELAAAGLIQVESRRILLIPVCRITPRRPYLSRRLAERVGRAVLGGLPIGRVDQDIRVLSALAAAVRLRVVLSGRDWSRGKARIAELSEPVEPISTALRKTVEAAQAATYSGG